MKRSISHPHRFILLLIIYALIVLVLWSIYHAISYDTIRRSERSNALLSNENLTRQISAEFSSINNAATEIVQSALVSDFMQETEITAYYEKAAAVSDFVRKSAFPITSVDSVISISDDGRAFRFSGGLSNNSLSILYERFRTQGAEYTVVILDNTYYFCVSIPVIDNVKLGNILILAGLDRISRALDAQDNVDRMLLVDDFVILSNNPELEGLRSDEVESMYGAFVTAPISGTSLSVAAAISESVLSGDSTLFIFTAITSLLLMLIFIVFLYRSLSGYVLRPMTSVIDEAEIVRRNMRLGLLASQIDAHFVVNTLKNIKRLSETGHSTDAGEMADGLAAILQHRHKGDALVNVFDEFEMLNQYISIMNMKFDEKFIVEYDVDDRLEACRIPGFILQPIVENALTHGLQNKESDAQLCIRGYIRDAAVIFEISDNGNGMPREKLTEIKRELRDLVISDFPEPGLRGVALTNIQRRIRIQCGDNFGIIVNSTPGSGTTVVVYLPLEEDR